MGISGGKERSHGGRNSPPPQKGRQQAPPAQREGSSGSRRRQPGGGGGAAAAARRSDVPPAPSGGGADETPPLNPDPQFDPPLGTCLTDPLFGDNASRCSFVTADSNLEPHPNFSVTRAISGLRRTNVSARQPSVSPSLGPGERTSQWPDAEDQIMSGPHTITEQHRSALRELRQRLQSRGLLPARDTQKLCDDDLLIRFLIARKLDIDNTEKMFVGAHEWRGKDGIDNIFQSSVKDFRPDIAKLYPVALFGVDREGRPVFWQRPEPQLVKQLLAAYSIDDVLRYYFYIMERCRELCKQMDPPVDRWTVVLDIRHAGVRDIAGETGQFIKKQTHAAQQYYPECMRRMMIINAGWVFSGIWKIVKSMLDPRVQDKIMVGDDKLFAHIDPMYIFSDWMKGGQGHARWEDVCLRPDPHPITDPQYAGPALALFSGVATSPSLRSAEATP